MPVVIKQSTKIPLFANTNKKILEGVREFSGKKGTVRQVAYAIEHVIGSTRLADALILL